MLYPALLWSFFHLCHGATYLDVTLHPNWHLLDHDKCGIATTNRLLSGTDTAMGEFPWVARIGLDWDGKLTFFCHGVLINRLYVLALPVCIVASDERLLVYVVRLGEYDTTTNPDCDSNGLCADPHQDIGIAYIVYHRDYNANNMHTFNIGLLRLSSPAKLGATVAPVCLPVGRLRGMEVEGKTFIMAGFGYKEINGTLDTELPARMQKVPVMMLDPLICRRAYINSDDYVPGQLCGQTVSKGPLPGGLCYYDYGVPLTGIETIGGVARHYLIGVGRSFDSLCNKPSRPNWNDFFNVSYHEMWILDNLSP